MLRLTPSTTLSVRAVGGHTAAGTLPRQRQFLAGGVDGLLRGNSHFFLVQCGAVLVSSVWAFVFTLGMLWLINRITPVKVTQESESLGLDESIHGEQAYTGSL